MTAAKSKTAKTETKVPYLVALDVGFGELKYMSSAFPTPSAIPSGVLSGRRPSQNKLSETHTIDPNQLIVSTDEGTYFVGQHALNVPTPVSKRTQVRDRATDPSSRVLFQTGLGLSVPHESGDYEVFLVTGLPNEDYDLSIRDNLEDFINREFTVTFHLSSTNSITKNIKIVGSDIIRQPVGTVTYHQFAFSSDTEEFITTSENYRSMTGVIDVGHFTTDYCLFENGIMIEDSMLTGSTVAVTEVYKRLKNKIFIRFAEEGYQFKPDDKDLDTIIRTNRVFYAGREHDVSKQVEEAAREVAAMIAKEVLDTWGNETNRLETILLSGGGAYVIAEHLNREFAARRTQEFQIIEKPQFSNVQGFYMYGTLILTGSYTKQEVLDSYVRPAFVVGAKL